MKKLCLFFSFALLVVVLAGCGGGGGGGAAVAKVPASISVTPDSPTAVAGSELQFIATAMFAPPDATKQDLTSQATWTSSNEAVAKFSTDPAAKGKVTGLAAGTTTITAKYNDLTASTTLMVEALNPLTDVALTGYHHLGDGKWGNETENSQFTYPLAGKTYTQTFALLGQPQTYAFATLTFIHRGSETSTGYKNTLTINSYTDKFPTSNVNGSFTEFSVKLPSNIFLSNQPNTITVQSGNVSYALEDYDDFEFQNILIKFSN